jgi:hypothetical protein
MFRILMGLIGVVGLVVAASLSFGGGSLLLLESTLSDEDGFINSVPFDIEVDGYAVVAGPAEIELTPDVPVDLGEIATLRIRAVHEDPTQSVFVGVADADDVDAYLGGVPHAIVEDLDDESFSLTYRVDASEEAPGSPSEQPFWIDSTHGPGLQTIEWEIDAGDVSFVVMNEDASDGISFEAVVGARIPLIRPVGTGLLIGGGVALVVGTLLLALAL